MKIILDKEWFIEDDGKGYTLIKFSGKTRTDKKGNVTQEYDYQSYPPTIIACVEKYIRMSIVDSYKEIELKDYLQKFDDKYDEMVTYMKELGITR